jgi:hypothetical protein
MSTGLLPDSPVHDREPDAAENPERRYGLGVSFALESMRSPLVWLTARTARWDLLHHAIAWGGLAWLIVGGTAFLRGSVIDEAMGVGLFAYAVVVASVWLAGYLRQRIRSSSVARVRSTGRVLVRPSGDRPTLSSYGLSEEDVRLLEGRDKRLSSRLNNAGATIGVLCGLLLGIIAGELSAVVSLGFFGLIVGSIVAQVSTGPIVSFVKKRDPLVERYWRFQKARDAFDARVREAEEREHRRKAAFWQSLSGHAFERELAVLFERAGYFVQRTPGSGDGGIDIVLKHSGRTTLVQCKQTKNPVGPAVARELYGALKHSDADDGILAVTGGVTSGVTQFFVGKPLRVMDLAQILSLHEAVKDRPVGVA